MEKTIAAIKWYKGFKCLKCKHSEAYVLKDYGRKCAKCKKKESVRANTAFHGKGLEPELVLQILRLMFHQWLDWENGRFPEWYNRRQGEHARLSIVDIQSKLGHNPSVIWRALHRLTEWLPKSFEKDEGIYSQWFIGVKNKDHKHYTKLYNLIFVRDFEFPESEILVLLTLKGMSSEKVWDFLNDNDIESE